MKPLGWICRVKGSYCYLPESSSNTGSVPNYSWKELTTVDMPRIRPTRRGAIAIGAAWKQGKFSRDSDGDIYIANPSPERTNVVFEPIEVGMREYLDGKPMVFVFGSNEKGIHGGGSAKTALNHYGAVWGKGIGHYGDSYGIPTKFNTELSLNIDEVTTHIGVFLSYAKEHPEYNFKVTCVGCLRAGFTDNQIAPLFEGAPDNCYFDSKWEEWLPNHPTWGTY